MARDFGFSQRKVDVSRFSMVPRPDVPRSTFKSQHTHKTTFDAGLLVPIYVDEILPGDSVKVKLTAFVRMNTPLFPVMDNLYLDTFFFFVPNRLVWDNWEKMMGARVDPGDSIDYLTPQVNIASTGIASGSTYDYMGIPIGAMFTGYSINALPFRGLNLIWNEWFRDQNLQDSLVVNRDDGPDSVEDYDALLRRGKRHDYFTSALPWPQKGDAVQLPLGDRAPVLGIGYVNQTEAGGMDPAVYLANGTTEFMPHHLSSNADVRFALTAASNGYPDIYADLSEATAATINAIRTAFQVQRLLERDARGGTRYTEILQAHFGVTPQDSRLQRPEYLGGGSVPVNVTPVAQTSATGITGGDSPLGALGGVGMTTSQNGFSQSFTEHGFVIGLANVRADLTYQQGLHKMWTRQTRYDYYWPAFAHLGEQAVMRSEIFLDGTSSLQTVFGYQERWAEYRHKPSRISGMFRSGIAGTLDSWHLSQYFATAPVLSDEFIQDNPPIDRVVAAGELAEGQQFLADCYFDIRHVRAMPVFSVPGFIDRF